MRLLAPQMRLLAPQMRLLAPQIRFLAPQLRLLAPQMRLLTEGRHWLRDGFSFDITLPLTQGANELIVGVFDPTEGDKHAATPGAAAAAAAAVAAVAAAPAAATSADPALAPGGNQPHGKQYAKAFAATGASSKYTSTSGIWATVWLEFVPQIYIHELLVVSTVASASATVTANISMKHAGSRGQRQADEDPCCSLISLSKSPLLILK